MSRTSKSSREQGGPVSKSLGQQAGPQAQQAKAEARMHRPPRGVSAEW